MSIKVLHYYTYPENSGGPLTYIKNIMKSEYFPGIQFEACYQGKPISQIRSGDIRRIIKEIKTFSPDILHIHGVQSEGALGVFAGKRAGVPKILMTVHGIQIDAQNISEKKRKLFKYIVEPYALKNSDAVFCVCDAMSTRDFIKKNSKKLLPTIHNFITDEFAKSQIDEGKFHADTEKIIIATVGRLSKDKGMSELEECILQEKNPRVQYWIIGSGDYEETMKKNLAKEIEEEKVVFWGQQDNVKEFLHRADIFLFLSHHENLSIALLEAASQKCCCIATDVGGNVEVVDHENDGIVVPVSSSAEARKALDRVLEDDEYRTLLGEKIAKKASRIFSEKAFSEKLNEVYAGLYKIIS